MDISSTGLVQLATHLQTNQTAQDVQVAVIKKAINSEQMAATALLQMLPPVTGAQPLASSGRVGTQLHVTA